MDWFGPDATPIAKNATLQSPMRHVATREWHMACNWKIFFDNTLVRCDHERWSQWLPRTTHMMSAAGC